MPAPLPHIAQNTGIFGPMLIPGAMLLRRDHAHLQIGTAPGVVIAEEPGLAQILRLLDGSHPPARLAEKVARDVPEFTGNLTALIDELIALGAVILPPEKPKKLRVGVRHDRSTGHLAAHLSAIFGEPGIDPTVEVLLSAGEISRSATQNLWLAGITHLPVVFDESRVRIGPLVVPQETPCLNCLDEMMTSLDPAWAVLLPQFERTRLLPLAISGRHLLLAASEIVHQLECLSRGLRAPAVGAVLSIGPDHQASTRTPVPFAAGCDCLLLAA